MFLKQKMFGDHGKKEIYPESKPSDLLGMSSIIKQGLRLVTEVIIVVSFQKISLKYMYIRFLYSSCGLCIAILIQYKCFDKKD